MTLPKPVFSFTNEYRNSEEFKRYKKLIKEDYPGMDDYLIEMAVTASKLDPFAYKNEYKESKMPKPEQKPPILEYTNNVRIYSGIDDPDLPPLVQAKVKDVEATE